VRRRPYSVILFDEIEKAHHDVFNMLLQIMEEGRLTDSYGRHVDFKNVILILTSNIGADVIKNSGGLGFVKQTGEQSYEQMKQRLMSSVERHFRPEFLNRLDDTIVFRPLTREDLGHIVEIEFAQVAARLAERDIAVELTEDAKEFLIEEGYSPEFGARPLRRAIENHIEDPLAEELLRDQFAGGANIRVKVQEDHLYFETVEPGAAPEPEAQEAAAASEPAES
jgi:ATP-dependent Clp protease ATP-binding subunit ClpC